MPAYAEIAVAILAAGAAKRFGADKLMADMDGIPLGLHIARTIAPLPFGWRLVVCGAGIKQHFVKAGFQIIDNAEPDKGQSYSLHLAVRAAEATQAKALLILLADMPFVSAGHIAKVAGGDSLAASTDGQKPMPPALFPRGCWPDLLRTGGDTGARTLLADASLVGAPPSELRDIDVPADLPRPQT